MTIPSPRPMTSMNSDAVTGDVVDRQPREQEQADAMSAVPTIGKNR